MAIHIGDHNRIQNSVIAEHYEEASEKSAQHEKKLTMWRSIIISFITSFLVGFLLLFSFWDSIILFIESLF